MASYCYVTEYAAGSFAGIQAPVTPPLVRQARFDFSGGATQSAAFGGNTRLVEVTCDQICSIVCGGVNPTATTNDSRFVAGRVMYYVVTPGDKLSAIANT